MSLPPVNPVHPVNWASPRTAVSARASIDALICPRCDGSRRLIALVNPIARRIREVLPTSPTPGQVLELVDEWIVLLASEKYDEAFGLTAHDA